jgi:hypothetical protein
MSDLQLDPNLLIQDFADENAKSVTRALVAEAQGKRYVEIITSLHGVIKRLSEHAPDELLYELGLKEKFYAAEDEEPEPPKRRAPRRTAGPKLEVEQ